MVWVPLDTFFDTAYRRVVPLYSFDGRGRPFLLASSVPFQDKNMRFLITATHCCFKDGKPLPLLVYGENQTHALTDLRGAWAYSPGQVPDLDVAVIRLEPSCADDLQERHWFCTPDDVRSVLPKTPRIHYLIAGYPASRNRKRPIQYGLPSRATALITGEICSVDEVRSVDKTDEHHFAVAFPHKKVTGQEGKDFHVPPPYGMSGGGVWRVEIDPVERLVNSPYLVGIGVEYHKAQKIFVATRVQAVAPLARDLNYTSNLTTIA